MSASRITDPTPITLSVFEVNSPDAGIRRALCVNVKLPLK